jgi:hypothetical protein
VLFSEGDEFGRSLGLEVLEFHFPHGESWSLEMRDRRAFTNGGRRTDRERREVAGLN